MNTMRCLLLLLPNIMVVFKNTSLFCAEDRILLFKQTLKQR